MNTNDDNKDGTYIENLRTSLWQRIMFGYATRFDRKLYRLLNDILPDEELRRQQEKYLKPVKGETWESIKMTIDELAKPNKNLIQPSFSIDEFRTPSDVKAPDHNISIDEVCNMLINNALCNKYWSDNNDKPPKRR